MIIYIHFPACVSCSCLASSVISMIERQCLKYNSFGVLHKIMYSILPTDTHWKWTRRLESPLWMTRMVEVSFSNEANAGILFPFGLRWWARLISFAVTVPLHSTPGLCSASSQRSHSDEQLLALSECLQTYTSCLRRPRQPITLRGALSWLLIGTSRSFGHMVFDY